MARRRRGFTMIELAVVVAIITVLISLLLPAVQAAREGARRAQCYNNLMQLGLAIRSYETTSRVLPPGVVDRSGPIVEAPTAYQFGWIAQILPYMEARNVHKHLDFRVGVYDIANMTATGTTISTLLCPSNPGGFRATLGPTGPPGFAILRPIEPARTQYAACYNDVEGPIDSKNAGVFYLNSRTRFDEIEDGLAHTIFVGEKKHRDLELGWASGTRSTLRNAGTPPNRTELDPMDLVPFLASFPEPATIVDPDNPEGPPIPNPNPSRPRSPPTIPIRVGGFGSFHPNGSNFLMGDGSVRFLKNSIDPGIYRLLGNRADGQPIGDDRF